MQDTSDYFIDDLALYFEFLLSGLTFLKDFEAGKISFDDFDDYIDTLGLNLNCYHTTERIRVKAVDQLRSKQALIGGTSNSQRNQFIKMIFPDLYKDIKESFESRIRWQLKQKPLFTTDIVDKSWVYCPYCIEGFNCEEGKVYFTRLPNTKQITIFCPKCCAPLNCELPLHEKSLTHAFLGVVLNQKHLKILAKL